MTTGRLPAALVALYAGPGRRVGVLLRQPLLPLPEEREPWLEETRAAARAVADALGVPLSALQVLQWSPPTDVAEIVRAWRRVWIGDEARCRALTRAAERHADDERYLATIRDRCPWQAPTGGGVPSDPPPSLARPDGPLARLDPDLAAWYGAMGQCWTEMEPHTRRQLVLRTQRWLAEYLLERPAPSSRVAHDLYPALLPCVPADEQGRWRPWIRLVTDDLTGALALPPERRDRAWTRRLFLIPYSLPVPGPPAPRRLFTAP